MSKLAALGLSLTGSSLTGLGLAALGSLGEYAAQQQTANKQKESNRQWVAWQRQQQERAKADDKAKRDENYENLQEYLAGADQETREQVVEGEGDRLTDYLSGGDSDGTTVDAVNDKTTKYGTKTYNDYAAGAIAEATQAARDRIKALAKTSAYGGSSGGLASTRASQGMDAQNAISNSNADRESYARILERYQEVQPEVFQYRSTGLGNLLGGVAGNIYNSASYDNSYPSTKTTGSAWTSTG